MKSSTVLVVVLVVLSSTITYTGTHSVSISQIEETVGAQTEAAGVSADELACCADSSTNNATDTAGKANEVSTDYHSREIPPSELENVTVNTSTIPEDISDRKQYHSMSSGDSPVVGTTKVFPTLNQVSGEYTYRNFTLRSYTEHSAVWVAENLSWPDNDTRQTPNVTDAQIEQLTTEFERTIYPTDRRLFGTPEPRYGTDANVSERGGIPDDYYRSPDNESRTIILLDNVRDENYFNESYPTFTAGFYSQSIERQTDRNVLTIDAYNWSNRLGPMDAPWRPETNESAGNESAYDVEGTVAHELQHLIHADLDENETTWIDEGLSDYAEYAAGYGFPEQHIEAFERRPNNSLVEWGDQGDRNILADYGGAALFQVYLSQQYGESFLQRLARDHDNGIQSVENILAAEDADEGFYDLYQDFSTALVVDSMNGSAQTDDPSRYRFEEIALNVSTGSNATSGQTTAWGSSYTNVGDPPNSSTVRFTANGTEFQPLAWEAVSPPKANDSSADGSNDTVLWGNRGNLKDNAAIMSVDLRDTQSPTLSFETYYDIEQGWDFGFVQVSTDGGETWTTLSNENTTERVGDPENVHPAISKHRPGFTGDTGGEWVTESFDLSAYSGQEVLLSFRYMTDWASNGNSSSIPGTGWYLRDIQIPQASLFHTGSSTAPFRDSSEIRNERVGYQFTTIGITEQGQYEIEQFDAETFPRGHNKSWLYLRTGASYDRMIVQTTWAARQNETGTVPYELGLGPGSDFFEEQLFGVPPRAGVVRIPRSERNDPER